VEERRDQAVVACGPEVPGKSSPVVRSSSKISALLFLFAFALGGVAVPLAHELDHYLDGADAPVHHEASLLPVANDVRHDCTLCDVKLAATDTLHPAPLATAHPAEPPATAPDRMLATSVRTFDGRAPPILS